MQHFLTSSFEGTAIIINIERSTLGFHEITLAILNNAIWSVEMYLKSLIGIEILQKV